MTNDLRTKMTTALEIAVLVQSIPLEKGAALIEQYAQTVAAGARVDATSEAAERMEKFFSRALEAPLCAK